MVERSQTGRKMTMSSLRADLAAKHLSELTLLTHPRIPRRESEATCAARSTAAKLSPTATRLSS